MLILSLKAIRTIGGGGHKWYRLPDGFTRLQCENAARSVLLGRSFLDAPSLTIQGNPVQRREYPYTSVQWGYREWGADGYVLTSPGHYKFKVKGVVYPSTGSRDSANPTEITVTRLDRLCSGELLIHTTGGATDGSLQTSTTRTTVRDLNGVQLLPVDAGQGQGSAFLPRDKVAALQLIFEWHYRDGDSDSPPYKDALMVSPALYHAPAPTRKELADGGPLVVYPGSDACGILEVLSTSTDYGATFYQNNPFGQTIYYPNGKLRPGVVTRQLLTHYGAGKGESTLYEERGQDDTNSNQGGNDQAKLLAASLGAILLVAVAPILVEVAVAAAVVAGVTAVADMLVVEAGAEAVQIEAAYTTQQAAAAEYELDAAARATARAAEELAKYQQATAELNQATGAAQRAALDAEYNAQRAAYTQAMQQAEQNVIIGH